MTSLALLLWIVLGIVLQLAIYLGIGFWRHWQDYQALRSRATDLPVTRDTPPAEETTTNWPGFRTFRVERKVIEDAAQSVCSFYLVPEDGQPLPPFLPGQFLTFRLDVPTHHDNYRISIKRVPSPPGSDYPPGRSSSFFHDQVVVGSRLQVRAPAGHFHVDRSDVPVVLIAGGIGITPMLSMLNWSLAEQPGREVWLFYGVRHGRELVMKTHLEALAAAHPNFHLRLCFSDPLLGDLVEHDFHLRGRVDVSLLRAQLPLKPYHFYICGPTPMMASLVSALEDWGVPDAHIHFEAFGPASIKRKNATTTDPTQATDNDIVVTFAQSGKQLPWQPGTGSLLEFAEANGIAVDFGCRAGGCGTCQTTIRRGEVSYRQSPDYDPEPGTCLLCVCVPKTSVTLEA
ncbi:MAG: hypothetical protein B7Y41_01870 [Hydrogenophilales bacterium 28-61-23]|nr:MAG: hypothetical protein B7Y41_01870 [Hydrogenophilales bacterium 28-61-23]